MNESRELKALILVIQDNFDFSFDMHTSVIIKMHQEHQVYRKLDYTALVSLIENVSSTIRRTKAEIALNETYLKSEKLKSLLRNEKAMLHRTQLKQTIKYNKL